MEKRRLGKTEIEISPIGLGTWQFSQGANMSGRFWATIDRETIKKIVGVSLKGGVNWFDTAELYGNGRSEKNLAAALQELGVKPGEVAVATKWFPLLRTAGSIGKTLPERIANLAPYPIDLFQVHMPLSLSSVAAQMRAMAECAREGKIRFVGVSNFSASMMEAAQAALEKEGMALASNQIRMSLVERKAEENGILAAAKRLGITLIAYSPLAQGLLTGRYHDDPALIAKIPRMRRTYSVVNRQKIERTAPLIAELKAVAAAYGVTPAQVSLNWLVYHYGETVVAIPGATRPEQAEKNAAAMAFRLTEKELTKIDEASRSCLAR
jgi:aryl-alcohol dehydrogenase-like predicted oxidoreductase